MFTVTSDVLDPQALVSALQSDEDGAVCLFYGVVRNNNLGRRVLYLEYDAYAPMALKIMREIAEDVKRRYPVSAVGAFHRTGRLEIGETSLLVAVASPHRAEAFDACHYAVDRIKELVPVWKKEVFEGGEEWIEGNIPSVEAAKFEGTAASN